jgi:hypothetical protein
LRKSQEIQCTTAIVYDRYRNPLVVVVELTPGHEVIYDRRDPDFDKMLRTLGVDPGPPARQLILPRE